MVHFHSGALKLVESGDLVQEDGALLQVLVAGLDAFAGTLTDHNLSSDSNDVAANSYSAALSIIVSAWTF